MPTARLMYCNDENWVYATGMRLSDPSIWYQDTSGKTHILISSLEIQEAREIATVDFVHPYPKRDDLPENTAGQPGLVRMIAWLINHIKEEVKEIEIPGNFPAILAQQLSQNGYTVKPVEGTFFTGRNVKTQEQIEALRTAQHNNQKGFTRIISILKEADIAKDLSLIWKGDVLTSEILRAEMKKAQIDVGAIGFNNGPIISCAGQSAMPHERGHGPLKANEFIVVDSFPMDDNNYNGDLTRTYVKGTASTWHQDVYGAVLEAQQTGLSLIKEGANGKDIHAAVAQSLADAGFKTGVDADGNPYGFFHGTGHGVGLAVHDYPQGTISGMDCPLKAGHCTSVEPGLYYPGKGGCRIEDVVIVTKTGHDNLTTQDVKDWVL